MIFINIKWALITLWLIFAGKGAFGKVLLAKAEGIVPDTPAKDIVAVKTAKGKCPFYKDDFLHNYILCKIFRWCLSQ